MKTRTPKCRKCSSTDVRATGSQQRRKREGKQRLHDHATCNHCGHEWWSRSKAIIALGRKADLDRKAER